MSNFNAQMVDGLEDPIKEFINFIEDQKDGQIPRKEIYAVNENGSIVTTHAPSLRGLTREYKEKSKDFFDETVDWMIEGEEIPKEGLLGEDTTENEDILYMYLRGLAGETMDYCGGYGFDRESFEKAVDDVFSSLFDRKTWGRAVIPIINFESGIENLVLNTNIELANQDHENDITKIEIGEITPTELATIYNAESAAKISGLPSGVDWSHVIRIENNGVWGEQLFESISDMVISGLRLFKNTQPRLFKGPVYQMKKGSLNHNYGLLDWVGKYPAQNVYSVRDNYVLNKNKSGDFVIFWNKYREYLYTGDRSAGNKLVEAPLARFNYMYERSRAEDQILDCMIGLESSILKDTNSCYSMRLPIRSTLLLQERLGMESSYIYEFFESLYQARNSLIHGDGDLQSRTINGNKMTKEEFVRESRFFLSEIIIEYMEKDQAGWNIHQTNTEILKQRLTKLLQKSSDLL